MTGAKLSVGTDLYIFGNVDSKTIFHCGQV